MNMEKLQGAAFKKTIFKHLVLENNKAINTDIISKIRKYFKRNTNSDYKIDNLSNLEKPIIESFTFSTGNYCEIIGNKMFVNPKLFTNSRNPFVNGIEKCLFILDIPNRKNIRLLLIYS
jgi:hypothetical protein